MALTTLTRKDLYEEIADLARDQGVADQATWDELVDEVVEGHLSLGELDLDQDIEGMKESLSMGWDEYKVENEVEDSGVVEDEVETAPYGDDDEEDEEDEEDEF